MHGKIQRLDVCRSKMRFRQLTFTNANMLFPITLHTSPLPPLSTFKIPNLEQTLSADTSDVLRGVAQHDMAEAIEYVVCGIAEVRDELQEAFLVRDKGRTGALGGTDFKVYIVH